MLTSDLRGIVSRRKDPFSGWGKGKLRAEGRPRGTPPPPPPPAQANVFPLHVEGKTHGLDFAAEQIFLLPLCRLESASFPASSTGLQSSGLELWGGGQIGHPRQSDWSEDCGPVQRALLSPYLPLLGDESPRQPQQLPGSALLPILHVAAELSFYNF